MNNQINYTKLLNNEDIEYIFSYIKDEQLKRFINELLKLRIKEEEIRGDNMQFDDMTLKEIRELDLENCRKMLNDCKDLLHYDNDAGAWFIDDTEVVDELWYDCYTIIHPKEIIGYVEEIIEDEMKIPKGNQSLANWQADKLDNMIRDTLPDDELI